MAIKVTGILKNDNKVYENPTIHLVPSLEYRGKICLDAFIVRTNTTASTDHDKYNEQVERIDALTDNKIRFPDVNDLPIDQNHINPYDDFISSIEEYVINVLGSTNPNCSFEKF